MCFETVLNLHFSWSIVDNKNSLIFNGQQKIKLLHIVISFSKQYEVILSSRNVKLF